MKNLEKCKHNHIKADDGWVCVDCGYRFPKGTKFRVDREVKPKDIHHHHYSSGEDAYYDAGGAWCIY